MRTVYDCISKRNFHIEVNPMVFHSAVSITPTNRSLYVTGFSRLTSTSFYNCACYKLCNVFAQRPKFYSYSRMCGVVDLITQVSCDQHL